MSPSAGNIFVSVTRPGKETKTVEVAAGSTVEDVFVKADIARSDYQAYTVTDEDGDNLTLSDALNSSTQLICGARVAGA